MSADVAEKSLLSYTADAGRIGRQKTGGRPGKQGCAAPQARLVSAALGV